MDLQKLFDAIINLIVEGQTLRRGMSWPEKKNLMISKCPAFTEEELDKHRLEILKSFADSQKRQTDLEYERARREMEEESKESPPLGEKKPIHLESRTDFNNRPPTPPRTRNTSDAPTPGCQPVVDDTIDVSCHILKRPSLKINFMSRLAARICLCRTTARMIIREQDSNIV